MSPAAETPPLDLAALRARMHGLHGETFWRSLEEAARTPEFQELLAREFAVPLPADGELSGRRHFLKLMAASLALAGIGGCHAPPAEKIVPYVRAPEDIVPGKPLFYATAFVRAGYALGILAESHMGRPTKIEGNPEHPASRGATDAFAQASVLGMYDPDRSQTVMYRGRISTWDHFLTATSTDLEALRNAGGRGLYVLTETVTSPTLASQLQALQELLPEMQWHQYDPFGRYHARAASQQAFGRGIDTIYHFDRADVILSLGSDFLLELPGSVRYARDFVDRRRVSEGVASLNRLYVVESTPSCTGAMADHRLPLTPRSIQQLARALARGEDAAIPGVSPDWLRTLRADLQRAGNRSLVIAGEAEPPLVHVLAHAINRELGAIGETVQYVEPIEANPVDQMQSMIELVEALRAGKAEMLVMLGGNPVYNAPGELNFKSALEQVKHRIHLSEYYDETSFLCDWHLPAAHYLESWSDARAYDGTTTIIQPLIEPLYGGRTSHEVIAVLSGHAEQSAYQLLEDAWRARLGDADFSRVWRKALHDGFVENSASPAIDVELQTDALGDDSIPTGDSPGITLLLRPDPTVYDGRYANNAWLQELPKPLTKITWENALLVSPAMAEQLGLASEQVVEIGVLDRKVSAPVWIMPGHADGCVTLTAGYGRTMAGEVGSLIGSNPLTLWPARHGWAVTGAVLTPTGQRRRLATTQSHHSMEGRDLVRTTTHEAYLSDPHHLQHRHHALELTSLYGDPFTYEGNAWGMVIDQTACMGCNACVVACQSENNIPVVGQEQVALGREMHWLRIDRYYQGSLDEPQMYFQPLLCMHCEQAPCEVVCPVAATVHSSEGLNDMVYNRCVGTRYCSNNCPYKVRRFNYLQYSDEETPSLKLMRNPDVTVRSRGVMEKCTYCVQRINSARIDASKENRDIRDGEIVTACQAACPTRAIVFGNINDEKSQVRRLKDLPLNYGLLTELNTRPRTSYLARVTNPHPDLATVDPHAHESNSKTEDPT